MSNKKLTGAERFANLVKKQKRDGSLQIDMAKLELSEQVFQIMENKGMSEAELARRLKVSRAYVNKILQGSTNFTIETLVKIGIALDSKFTFEFVEEDSEEDIPEAKAVDLLELSSVS
jgi:transcriptional regulator with XRE-family HTH domain